VRARVRVSVHRGACWTARPVLLGTAARARREGWGAAVRSVYI
jgi:hypothetical protein